MSNRFNASLNETSMKIFLRTSLAAITLYSPCFAGVEAASTHLPTEHEDKGWYMSIGLGLSSPNEPNVSKNSSSHGKLRFDNGFSGEIGIGYDWGENWRTEFNYIKNKQEKASHTIGSGATFSKGDVDTDNYILTFYRDFQLKNKSLEPYIGVGGGVTTIQHGD